MVARELKQQRLPKRESPPVVLRGAILDFNDTERRL